MKKIKMFFAAAVLTLTTLSAQAQMPTAEERATKQTENMATELALTPEQKSQIYTINLGIIQKNDAIRDNASMTPEMKKEHSEQNHAARNAQIKSILTSEQAAKFDEMEKNQGLRRKMIGNEIRKPIVNE